ncbi:MAG: FAD-binding protein [Terracidiphilus sp.]
MEPNWFANLFKRLPTEVSSDLERSIVGNLEGLLDHPNDETLIDATIQRLHADPKTFMSIVSAHFSVPTPVAGIGLFAKADEPACGMAKTWKNYVATQTAQPYEIVCPATLADLQAALQKAAALYCAVRAVGSHHAFSDAALTDGIAIETHQLLEPLVAAEPAVLKNPDDASTVVRVSGGMTIHDLNAALDRRGLALINMGSYDGQTLAGVISTSTHGSGITLGSFPSAVEALIVVKADGQVVQIEPANGITDPAKFAAQAGNVQLIQDDKFFQASVVGIGSLGIVFAVLLRVRRQFWLSETITLHKWSELRGQLRDGALIRAHRHVEVVINPHVLNGDNTCMLTLRDEVPKPTVPSPPKPFRNLFAQFLANLPGSGDFLDALVIAFPTIAPKLVEASLQDLSDPAPYVGPSYELLNVGSINTFPAVSSELGVDLNLHVDAIDAVLALAAEARAEGTYHCGVVNVRYVAPSPGYLSMQPRETCMIELPIFRGSFGSDSLPWRYENALTDRFNARPHWGQRNFLTGSHQMLERLYGAANVAAWLDIFQWFNPGGQFSSRFTDRVGFSSHAPGA